MMLEVTLFFLSLLLFIYVAFVNILVHIFSAFSLNNYREALYGKPNAQYVFKPTFRWAEICEILSHSVRYGMYAYCTQNGQNSIEFWPF